MQLYGRPEVGARRLREQLALVESDPEAYQGVNTARLSSVIDELEQRAKGRTNFPERRNYYGVRKSELDYSYDTEGKLKELGAPLAPAGEAPRLPVAPPEVTEAQKGLLTTGDVENLVQIYRSPLGPKFHLSKEYARKLASLGVVKTGVKYRDTLAVELTDKGRKIVQDFLGEKEKPEVPQLPGAPPGESYGARALLPKPDLAERMATRLGSRSTLPASRTGQLYGYVLRDGRFVNVREPKELGETFAHDEAVNLILTPKERQAAKGDSVSYFVDQSGAVRVGRSATVLYLTLPSTRPPTPAQISLLEKVLRRVEDESPRKRPLVTVDAGNAHERFEGPTIEDFRSALRTVWQKAQAPPSLLLAPPGTEAGYLNLGPIANALRDFADESLKPVDVEKGIIRENAAELALKRERFQHSLKAEINRWGKKSVQESLDFMDNMENGQPQANPQDQALADILRKALDERRDAIRGLGKGKLEHFIQDYFPHIWEKPHQNMFARIFSKRSLRGPASFLKERTVASIIEGVEAGLKPVSWNPVELVMLKLHEMDRYLMGQKIIGEMKERGLTKFVRITQQGPEGWSPVDDRLFTVYGPPRVNIKEAYDAQVMDALQKVADRLGIEHTRKVAVGGKRWGFAEKGEGVVTKFAGPESVLTHEIGHILDWKYGLSDQLVKNPEFKKELRALADLRFEGQEPTQAFQRYVRQGGEKMAAMIQGYVHAPEKFRSVAPNTYRWLHDFLSEHEELKPLLEIKPSLVLAEARATVSTGGITIRGRYWAPKEVANVLNRYLSPGLAGNKLYDFWRGTANTLNQAQLGMSAFHLMFTSMDASISDLALGIEHATSGHVGKALAPTLRAFSLLGSPINTYLRGNRLIKEALEPGRYRQYSQLADALVAGGGRIRMDRFYKNNAVERFWHAWKGGDWRTAIRQIVPATLEYAAKPLMEHLVPRQKLGVFVGLAEKELARLGPSASREQVRAALGKVWDSVDNRMGQLVYDNLFWRRAVKDLGMASVRSLGWNIGTVREIGGGLVDWTRQPLRVLAGQKPELTHRMAYVLALPIVVGWAGAVLQYLYTGKGPTELKDYFFPKTGATGPDGRPERVSLASYMRDVYSVSHHPVETVAHKVHPLASSVVEMLENRDFYGVEVRHPDDPLVQQLGDVMAYASEQFLPFSARYYHQERQTGESRLKSAGSFFGIVPAPAYIRRSRFENAMRDYLNRMAPQGPRTREQAEVSNRLADYRRKLASHQMTVAQLNNEVGKGNLTQDQLARIRRQVREGPLVSDFRRLPVEQAVELWPLATDSERRTLGPLLRMKIGNAQIPITRKQQLWEAIHKGEGIPRLPFTSEY